MDADQKQKGTVNIDKLRTNAESCEKNIVAQNAMIWRACSPHEWVWTEEQQAEMARYCLNASLCVDYVLGQLRNKS